MWSQRKLPTCCSRVWKRFYAAAEPWSYKEAIAWQKSFDQHKIPQDHISLHFSRSSGPGGQNVNKVNTKVDLRLSLSKSKWIPDYAIEKIKNSNQLKKSKENELIVTSDKTRSQAKNIQDCYAKLVKIIKEAVAVTKEPDEATLLRVKKLREIEDKNRKELKKRQSKKKQDRKWKGNDF